MDSYTKALLHMDGADAATTFRDEIGNVWTAAGNAQIDTAQSKFGGASALFDGAGDYISTPDSIDWQLDGGSNSNKWTVDFWVRFNGDPGAANQGLIHQYQNDNNGWSIILITGNTLRFIVRSAGANIVLIDGAWNPADATWYHIAIVKDGTNGYMFFVDGSQVGSTTIDTSPIPDFSGSLFIGRWISGTSGIYYFTGWIDELRIRKGIARWTSNFTPQTQAYGDGLLWF